VRNKNEVIISRRARLHSFGIVILLLHVGLYATSLNAQQSPLPPGTTAGSTGGLTIPGITTGGSSGGSSPQSCGLNNGEMCSVTSPVDSGSNGNSSMPMSQVGNPVSLITSNKYEVDVDYQSSASKLQFNRHYNSQNSDFNIGFGQGWSSTYSTKLLRVNDEGYDILQGTGRRSLIRHLSVDETGRNIARSDNPAMGYIVGVLPAKGTTSNPTLKYLSDWLEKNGKVEMLYSLGDWNDHMAIVLTRDQLSIVEQASELGDLDIPRIRGK